MKSPEFNASKGEDASQALQWVKEVVHCTTVMIFFDDEISGCLEMQGEEALDQIK